MFQQASPPELTVYMCFYLEFLSLYILGWAEVDELVKIARHVAEVDPSIPFTTLAFLPACKVMDVRPRTVLELAKALRQLVTWD